MLLKRAVIQHYKSLASVDVGFSDITVLVGPNGVGKSNFVDALRFFRDAMRDGLEHAVIIREGFERIRQNSTGLPTYIAFSLEFQHALGNKPISEAGMPIAHQPISDYQLTLSGKGGIARIESESSHFMEEAADSYSPGRFERQRNGQVSVNDYGMRMGPFPPDVFAIGGFTGIALLGQPLLEFSRSWNFYTPYPNTLRKLSSPTKENGLLEDGSNWASVVRALKRTKPGRHSLARIAEIMRVAVPGYKDVSVSLAGSYLLPQITLSTRTNGIEKEHKFDPIQLSDGTLRVFGILLALYQQPPPAFLVIEEPEQTIHPGVLPALAEAFKEASERTQIIITTHSPQLVDQFAPESIRVVSSVDGLTRISPIKASQVAAVKQQLMSLQEFMSAEGLLPEDETP